MGIVLAVVGAWFGGCGLLVLILCRAATSREEATRRMALGQTDVEQTDPTQLAGGNTRAPAPVIDPANPSGEGS